MISNLINITEDILNYNIINTLVRSMQYPVYRVRLGYRSSRIPPEDGTPVSKHTSRELTFIKGICWLIC